jgi:hypothetical protein
VIDWIDDPEIDDPGFQTRTATCRRCGKAGLEWVDCGGRPTHWKLYDGMKLHRCDNAGAIDDFEVVK